MSCSKTTKVVTHSQHFSLFLCWNSVNFLTRRFLTLKQILIDSYQLFFIFKNNVCRERGEITASSMTERVCLTGAAVLERYIGDHNNRVASQGKSEHLQETNYYRSLGLSKFQAVFFFQETDSIGNRKWVVERIKKAYLV